MFDQITKVSKGKQIVMFLDYDGTLSPIVDDPDRAFMSDAVSSSSRYSYMHLYTQSPRTCIYACSCSAKNYFSLKILLISCISLGTLLQRTVAIIQITSPSNTNHRCQISLSLNGLVNMHMLYFTRTETLKKLS